MEVKSHELSKRHACIARRAFPVTMDEKAHVNVLRQGITHQACREAVIKGWTKEEIREYLEKEFRELNFMNEKQRDILITDTTEEVDRYRRSEDPTYLTPLNSSVDQEIREDLTLVGVKPDFIRRGGPVFDPNGEKIADGSIEVIKILPKKPNVSYSEKDEELLLYAMLLMARRCVKAGSTVLTKASYYFLRKDSDRSERSKYGKNFDDNFFVGPDGKYTSNVITISELYVGGTANTSRDMYMEDHIKAFMDGIHKDECSDDDCKICQLYDICKYQPAPITVDRVSKKKSLRDCMLTDDQEKVVEFDEGNLRVIAGAGAGKTHCVVYRVITLILNGAEPEEILLITFTNAGVEEMRERLKLYAEDAGIEGIENVNIFTFNSFGQEIIKMEYENLGFTKEPKVIDDIERNRILAQLLTDHAGDPLLKGLDYRHFDMDTFNVGGALSMASKVFKIVKNNSYTEADFAKVGRDLKEDIAFIDTDAIKGLLRIYPEYDTILKRKNLVEYEDQESLLFDEVFRKDPFYLENLGINHVIVDEYQDSTERETEIIRMFTDCVNFKSSMVVGDDSQSIFGFRGTSPRYIINYPDYIGKPVEDVYLTENFRSSEEIVNYANCVIARNIDKLDKELSSTRGHIKPVTVKGFIESDEELDWIADQIKEKIDSGVCPDDIAFITREKTEIMKMTGRLTERGIETVIMCPELLMENSKVRAAIAFARRYQDPLDTKDLITYVNAINGGGVMELDKETLEAMMEDVSVQIEELYAVHGKERRDMYMGFLQAINLDADEVYENFLEGFKNKQLRDILEYCNDFYVFGKSQTMRRDRLSPGVKLVTAHSSKGLEWPVVFVSLTKFQKNSRIPTGAELEELRRLHFVAATRARDELTVTAVYISGVSKGASKLSKNKTYNFNLFFDEACTIVGQPVNKASVIREREERAEKERERKKQNRLIAQKKAAGYKEAHRQKTIA